MMVADLMDQILSSSWTQRVIVALIVTLIVSYITGIGSRLKKMVWRNLLEGGNDTRQVDVYTQQDRRLRVKWIASGIDPILNQLKYHAQSIAEEKTRLAIRAFPDIEPISYEESIMEDISQEGWDLKKYLKKYNELVRNYRDNRTNLLKAIGFYFLAVDDHEFSVINPIKGDKPAGICAQVVLTVDSPARSKGWIDDNLGTLQLLVPAVRKREQFIDGFQRLDELVEELQKQRQTLTDQLTEIRDEYVEHYDIHNTEIAEEQKSS